MAPSDYERERRSATDWDTGLEPAAPRSWYPEERQGREPSGWGDDAREVVVRAQVKTTAVQLEVAFEDLAHAWERETMFESVVIRKAMHPAYQRIIGMGPAAVPLILRRLRRGPAQWFWALTAITGEDPAEGIETMAGATEAWLRWGEQVFGPSLEQ